MRRQNPISVRVRAPSRGLVTRWPSESADLLQTQGVAVGVPGALSRSAVVASNVRYEDGVTCNSPGYERVKLDISILNGFVAHYRLDEATGTRLDATLNHDDLQETVDSLSSGVGQMTGLIRQAAHFGSALVAPAAPLSFAATAGDGSVGMTWAASTSATGYSIGRSLVSGGPYTVVGTSATTSFTDSTVTNGTTYYYVVYADGAGGRSSSSLEQSATPQVPAIDFSQLLWNPSPDGMHNPGDQFPATSTAGSGTASALPATFNVQSPSAEVQATGSDNSNGGTAGVLATITYNGPAITCHVISNLAYSGGYVQGILYVYENSPLNMLLTRSILAGPGGPISPGFADWTFTIPDTGGSPQVIVVQIAVAAGGDPSGAASVDWGITLTT